MTNVTWVVKYFTFSSSLHVQVQNMYPWQRSYSLLLPQCKQVGLGNSERWITTHHARSMHFFLHILLLQNDRLRLLVKFPVELNATGCLESLTYQTESNISVDANICIFFYIANAHQATNFFQNWIYNVLSESPQGT